MAKQEVGRDPVGRTVAEYDTELKVITTRPYTAEENAAQDAIDAQVATEAANKSTIETNLQQDYLNMQAIDAQTNAAIRTDPSQEIKDIAKAVRRLSRMALENYSGTD